ncbi:MAG: ATP-dependent RecD-like DNA helicase [Deinococcus sp.]|nr:ATP-dependent RecD-like DNA helicase [Deinococcus sp.]
MSSGDSAVTISGVVERLTYHNPQNGYTVAKLAVRGQRELVTVVGNFSGINAGESLRLTGWWSEHPKFGPQFKLRDYQVLKPATVVGIEKYLGSGLIKGVGPVTARRITAHFQLQTLEIIERDPDRLLEVPGVGPSRLGMIKRAWQEQQAIKEVMLFLQSHGVNTAHAVKIYKTYQDQAIGVVSQDPYRLAKDIWGIGFVTADKIAQAMGIGAGDQARVAAGVAYTLSQAADAGHTYLPLEILVEKAAEILKVDPALVQPVIEQEIARHELFTEDTEGKPVYIPPFYFAEQGVARRVKELAAAPKAPPLVMRQGEQILRQVGQDLSPQQQEAVLTALKSRMMVLTGGPGTGKTRSVRAMVDLFGQLGLRVLLASPTGRAAKRLSEVTGAEAKTIHRLLEFNPAQLEFTRNDTHPLEADVLVVDEASMLDLILANSLFKALGNARLVLVGDVDQLPSVGAGNVLRDLIDSGIIPIVRLTQIFRQAQGSLIIQNAHAVNQGQMPRLVLPGEERTDCYFLAADTPEQALELLVRVVRESLPRSRHRYDPIADVQVLCPMNRGLVGAHHLNNVLQAALNPPGNGPEVQYAGRTYRVGDKVIQLRNNYQKLVFNGDTGVITDIDPENQEVHVRFDEEVVFDYTDLNELSLGYSISVHRAQGSEYPATVIPILTQHYLLLQRNLLYTALTRAKGTAILLGQRKAIAMAVRNAQVRKRYSGLAERLLADAPCSGIR